MKKSDAIKQFGTVTALARAVRVTVSAISQWPELLPQRMVDRVQAALYRRQMAAKGKQR